MLKRGSSILTCCEKVLTVSSVNIEVDLGTLINSLTMNFITNNNFLSCFTMVFEHFITIRSSLSQLSC